MRSARPDWVFHLAAHGAYSWQRDAELIMQTNLVSTVRLLAACQRHGFAAFVNAGSSSEYGFQDHAPREDELPEPNSDYAVMKAAATLHCRFVAQRDDVHVVTLRLYSVYGPWEEPGRLMPTLVARGLEGRLPPLVSPDTPRDFVSVRDTERAFLLAAERTDLERGSVFNIGSGRQTTLREVVEVGARAAGRRGRAAVGHRAAALLGRGGLGGRRAPGARAARLGGRGRPADRLRPAGRVAARAARRSGSATRSTAAR